MLSFALLKLPTGTLNFASLLSSSHAERGHAVCVVWYTTELGGRLASGERLPPRVRATRLRKKRRPVHQVGSAFVGAEEEDLGLCVKVDDLLLNAGSLAGNKKVDDSVDVLLERPDVRGAKRGKDGTLRTTLGNVLVPQVLCRCECVVLIEEGTLVNRVVSVKKNSG